MLFAKNKKIFSCIIILFFLLTFGCYYQKNTNNNDSPKNKNNNDSPKILSKNKIIYNSVLTNDTYEIEKLTLDDIKHYKNIEGNLFSINADRPEILKILINKIGNEEAKKMILHKENKDNISSFCALDRAIENDNADSIEIILKICGDDAKIKEKFFKIIDNDSIKVFEYLIKQYPDLLTKTTKKGESLLMVATNHNSLKIKQFLEKNNYFNNEL